VGCSRGILPRTAGVRCKPAEPWFRKRRSERKGVSFCRTGDPRGGQAVVRCYDAGIVAPLGELRGKSPALHRYRRALSTIGAESVFFGSEQRPDPVPSVLALTGERFPGHTDPRRFACRVRPEPFRGLRGGTPQGVRPLFAVATRASLHCRDSCGANHRFRVVICRPSRLPEPKGGSLAANNGLTPCR
jgi:hypothetical protein